MKRSDKKWMTVLMIAALGVFLTVPAFAHDQEDQQPGPDKAKKIAEWKKLKEENPEKFQQMVQERKAKLKAKLEELKEKDPAKYEQLKEKIKARRKEKLEKLRQEDPEKFKQVMQEKAQKLEAMKTSDPARYQQFLKDHPHMAEKIEHREKKHGGNDRK